MQESMIYRIFGIFCIIVSLPAYYVAMTIFRNSIFPLIAYLVVGTLWLGAGIGLIIWPSYAKKARQRILTQGIKIKTKFFNVEMNSRTRVNGQFPYFIQTTWIDPEKKEVRTFRSENIWMNPSLFIKKGQIIDVYIDPKNPEKYFMDISFLKQEVQKKVVG